jgi:hypothetical protein
MSRGFDLGLGKLLILEPILDLTITGCSSTNEFQMPKSLPPGRQANVK